MLAFTRAGEHGVLWHLVAVAGVVDHRRAARSTSARCAWCSWPTWPTSRSSTWCGARGRCWRSCRPSRRPSRAVVPVGPLDHVVRRGARACGRRPARAAAVRRRRGDGALARVRGRALPDRRRGRRRVRHRAGGADPVKVGIVGLPNAGKSSLFNALTRAGAQAANYPFTTVEPNVAIVPVPDERLDAVVDTIKATPTVYETIEFHDIAGLVRGAHEGEGLGNKFLANIRETDALVHVVRAHDDEQVVHPEGRVDPRHRRRDDRDRAAVRRPRAGRAAAREGRARGQGRRQARWPRRAGCGRWSRRCEGRPARTVPVPAAAPDALRNLPPLTSKPVLYLANVGEGAAGGAGAWRAGSSSPTPRRGRARRRGVGADRGRAVRAGRRGGGAPCAPTSASASPASPPWSARRGSCWA